MKDDVDRRPSPLGGKRFRERTSVLRSHRKRFLAAETRMHETCRNDASVL